MNGKINNKKKTNGIYIKMQLIRIDLKLQRDLCAVLTTFRKYPATLMYLGIQLTPKDPEYQFYSKKNESVKKIRCV